MNVRIFIIISLISKIQHPVSNFPYQMDLAVSYLSTVAENWVFSFNKTTESLSEVSTIDVRLVGGKSNFEGRVEVFYNNTWGTVCDDNFDNLDARVFCFMLGYDRNSARAVSDAFYGQGNGTIWLDSLDCKGTEISVNECSIYLDTWGLHNCDHYEDAGVICRPSIRLVGGKTQYEGRVEVKSSTSWGTVCDTGFDTTDTQVFCHMLGYERFGASVFGNAYFGQGTGPIWLKNLTCSGSETSVIDCDNAIWGSNDCKHSKDVGIRCEPRLDVRLTGSEIRYEGRVEIFYSQSWGTVCGRNFGTSEAQVLCYMLGYQREGAITYGNTYFGQGNGRVWLDRLDCNGLEPSILTCRNSSFVSSDCDHNDDAGIRCKPRVRLVNGSAVNEGRIEIFHSGEWGTVCDDSFDEYDAQVFCYMLGYKKNGTVAKYGAGTGTIWMDNLHCSGSEHSVDECIHDVTWGTHDCSHVEDVGIKCQTKTGCMGLSGVKNGNYLHSACTEAISPVYQHCTLMCDAGFMYSMYQNTTCLRTGIWNIPDEILTCEDINECRDGPCGQTCHNVPGTYYCSCNEGYILSQDNKTCIDINECDINNDGCGHNCTNDIDIGRCQQICTNLEGSFLCSCEIDHILNGDGFTCDNVSQNSVSSSLMILTDVQKVKTLLDPTTYKTIAKHLLVSLQTYFQNYTSHPFSVVVQHMSKYGNVSEQKDNATVVVNYTIVYDGETSPFIRDTLIRGTFDFNVWKPLVYNGERVLAKLVNEVLSISPHSLVINIFEDTPTNTVIGEFTVNDPDLDVRVKLSVYSDDKPEEIKFGPIIMNKVQLILEGNLDADKYKNIKQGTLGPVIGFTIVVRDEPGLTVQANVSLNITDVNDNAPICSPSEVTVRIPRDTDIGDDIFNLDTVCKDDDYYYNSIVYTMEGDSCTAFEIETPASLLVKAKILDIFPSCLIIVNVADVVNALFSTTLLITIKFLECPADVDYLNNAWKRGTPGKNTNGSCPEGSAGEVKRFCDKDGVYQEPVYNCTRTEISEIFKKVFKENVSTSDVLNDLANVTATENTRNNSLLVGDLEVVNEVLSKITEIIEVTPDNVERVADSFIETANNILDESTTTSWTSKMNQTGSGANTVLENLDRFVEKIANVNTTTGKLSVAKSNLFLTVGSLTAFEDKEIQFPNKESDDVPEWAVQTIDTIHVPCCGNMTSRSYSGVMYRNLSQILPTTVDDRSITDKKINTLVMSFTYFPEIDVKLDKPVEITFQLYNSSLESPICSFWMKGNSSTGAWSSAGCVLDRFTTDNKTVVCKCNHLTNFAVLMSPSLVVSYHHHVTLSIISMVGCILSMLCLVLTVAVHGFYWRAVKSENSIINMNLSCVLFMAYLLFLAGVNQTENKGVCTAIAVLLHFAYLVVFFTMLSEGLLLANRVLYPLSNHKPGVPLLIGPYVMAVIIVAISMGAVELDGYGSEKSCWLSTDSGLIWAFLVPVLLVIAVNLAIVALVVKKMLGTNFMSRKTDKEKARACVRSIVILMPIMGVTWVLGIFSVNEDTVIFQYLFALFNSVQGVLIFVFHCVLNRKIQVAFKKSKWLQDVSVSSTQNTKWSRVANERSSAM